MVGAILRGDVGGRFVAESRQALPEAVDFEVDACQLEFSGEKFSFLTGTLFGESVVAAQGFGLGALACSFSKVRFSYCTELLEIGPAQIRYSTVFAFLYR